MIIKDELIEPFFIEVNEDQFILRETKQIDTTHFLSKGEEGEKEVTHGYFVDLSALIRKIIQIKLSREEKPSTLQQFWQAWINYSKKFTELINPEFTNWKIDIEKRITNLEKENETA